MRHLRRIIFFVSLLFLGAAPPISSASDLSPSGAASAGGSGGDGYALVTLTCVIIDAASADTIAARCSVMDCNGERHHPLLGESFYHTAHPGYFYADGSFSVVVPSGPTTVRVSHGPEYDTVVRSVDVSGDTTVCIALTRMDDLARHGWFGGDTHVHLNHEGGYYVLAPADAHMMASAEALSIVTCLDNGFHFTGAPDTCSTAQCIIYMSEERRTTAYGDLALLGLSRLIYPFSTDWTPLNAEASDSAHVQANTCVAAAHPVTTDDFWDVGGWPGVGLARELPVDVTRDRIDCFEVMSYSNCHDGGVELELWYRLLNCGFTLPACAGTDACMNRFDSYPLGVFRTYAHIPDDSLTYARWIQAVRAGETFVTNGPLITTFTVSDHTMGETVFLGRGCREIPCALSIRCTSGLERAEIVMNGAVIHALPFGGTRSKIDTSFNLTIDSSAWLAARVYGVNTHWLAVRDSLFAHTSPIYISMEGERIVVPEDASFFVDWISNLDSLARRSGYWPHMIDSVMAFDEFAAAKRFYEMLSDVTTTTGEYDDPPIPALFLGQNVPNPFTDGTTINFGINSAPGAERRSVAMQGRAADISIYDIRGCLVRRLFRQPVMTGMCSIYWDGTDSRGRKVASGIYFVRLRVGHRSRRTKMVLVR